MTSVRFLALLNAGVSTAVLQDLSPSFSVIAFSEVIGNCTSHLGDGIQDLLPTSTQHSLPACLEEADTHGLIAINN